MSELQSSDLHRVTFGGPRLLFVTELEALMRVRLDRLPDSDAD